MTWVLAMFVVCVTRLGDRGLLVLSSMCTITGTFSTFRSTLGVGSR